MAHIAERMEIKSMLKPEEVRDFEKGRLELVKVEGRVIGRATLQPGWKWSSHVKPLAGTEWCEAAHLQYQVSGTMKIKMEDGTEFTTKAGDVFFIPPHHDAWVVGEEEVVVVDFEGMGTYAQKIKK